MLNASRDRKIAAGEGGILAAGSVGLREGVLLMGFECVLALDSAFLPSDEQSERRSISYRNMALSSASWEPMSAASSYL